MATQDDWFADAPQGDNTYYDDQYDAPGDFDFDAGYGAADYEPEPAPAPAAAPPVARAPRRPAARPRPAQARRPRPTRPRPAPRLSPTVPAPATQDTPSTADIFQDFAGGSAAGTAAMMLGKNMMRDKLNVSKRFSWISMDLFRPYFQVDNSYVIRKLRTIVFPFLQKTWAREAVYDQTRSLVYKSPREDLNAPDLYIPSMALVTYILLIAYYTGISSTGFTPEVIGGTASKTLITLCLEVLIMRFGLFAFADAQSSAIQKPPFLDMACYAGYKFIALVLTIVVCCVADAFGINQGMPYYLTLLLTGASLSYFIVRTLKEVFVPTESLDGTKKVHDARNLFILILGGMQLFLCWFLGPPSFASKIVAPTVDSGSIDIET